MQGVSPGLKPWVIVWRPYGPFRTNNFLSESTFRRLGCDAFQFILVQLIPQRADADFQQGRRLSAIAVRLLKGAQDVLALDFLEGFDQSGRALGMRLGIPYLAGGMGN